MLSLRWKVDTTVPVEAECITPNGLAGKSADQIRALPVFHGNRQETLGEFFDVSGDAGDGQVALEGDCSRVKLIGAEMTRGQITVDGNAGMHLGAEMRGGRIRVRGNAGDWVGAEMRGGVIHVQGNAGHLVGAAYRGSAQGMRGGTILIEGSAGNEVGSTMRRGLIAIAGEVGDFSGVSMIAGSLFLFGKTGVRFGAGMKRGSIALFGWGSGVRDQETAAASEVSSPSALQSQEPDPPLLPTFRFDCVDRPVFLNVFLRQLRAWGFAVREEHFHGCVRRYHGDLVSLGKGEILVWEGSCRRRISSTNAQHGW